MIKNYHLVRKAETDYHSARNLSLEERIKIIDDMYLFSKKFEKKRLHPQKTPHLKMLIKLTTTFKRMGKLKNA